jgi:hypothetical protein
MKDPNSHQRERVRELRAMAGHARYQALRIAMIGAAPNMQAYADELEEEAERLERALDAVLAPLAHRSRRHA